MATSYDAGGMPTTYDPPVAATVTTTSSSGTSVDMAFLKSINGIFKIVESVRPVSTIYQLKLIKKLISLVSCSAFENQF